MTHNSGSCVLLTQLSTLKKIPLSCQAQDDWRVLLAPTRTSHCNGLFVCSADLGIQSQLLKISLLASNFMLGACCGPHFEYFSNDFSTTSLKKSPFLKSSVDN